MRYFFDLLNGSINTDRIGTVFVNDAAARQEAILRAQALDPEFRLERYNGFRSIVVRDETGQVVCEVSITC